MPDIGRKNNKTVGMFMKRSCKLNYFDNAATSFPKPAEAGQECLEYLNETGGPYGRSFYKRALDVSRKVENSRDRISEFFGISNADKLVFSLNATHALNTVLKGLDFKENKEVWISPLEHNAVTRPLKYLEDLGKINIKFLPSRLDGLIDMEKLLKTNLSKAGLIVICHQSNVTGLVQPAADIKKAVNKIPLLLDAAQSAGYLEIKTEEWDIDYLAFTGHKGLLGPTGTGGLYIKNPESLRPLLNGGTGSRSDSWKTPEFMPDKMEAGTPNIAGILGLAAALKHRPEPAHSKEEFILMMNEISEIPGITVYKALDSKNQGEVFSINLEKRGKLISPSDFGEKLYRDFGIETRVGLHCAPLAHQTTGSFPQGAVRISPSIYHGTDDFKYLLKAVKRTASEL